MKTITPGNQQGLRALKKVLANTGRKRLNIIGAVNLVTFEPTIMLTEENCCAEVIEAFLGELRQQYSSATSICIILDNARYQRSYIVQEKQKIGH
ncbi:MAG: transposase [Chitinophagaceae bacterium]|nr:transposase [Chitinophagaceae bacterium]